MRRAGSLQPWYVSLRSGNAFQPNINDDLVFTKGTITSSSAILQEAMLTVINLALNGIVPYIVHLTYNIGVFYFNQYDKTIQYVLPCVFLNWYNLTQ